MSKQFRTLVSLGNNIVKFTNEGMLRNVTRAELVAQCITLKAAEKARIDAEMVKYYAEKAGVEVKTREKGEPAEGRCSLVAAWDRDGKVLTPASNNASVALSRARAILFATEKGEAKKAAAKKAKAKPASNDDTFTALEAMAALAVKKGDKAQIKALKQRVTAVMLMLSA